METRSRSSENDFAASGTWERQFPRGSPSRRRCSVLKEGASEEDRRTGKRNRAPRGHKFTARLEILSPFVRARSLTISPTSSTPSSSSLSSLSIVVVEHTRSRTRAQGGHINSLRGIRIGPFQTSGGWLGGGGAVLDGMGLSLRVGGRSRAGRRVGGTFLDQ